ncbi:MAG: M24 family metallopeptidase [archaeon]
MYDDLKSLENAMLWEERHRYSLPKSEMERRWSGFRKRMAEQGIDYLVAQSQNRFVGGYFRYFTDIPGVNYLITCVFPLDGEMTLIGHGPPKVSPPLPDDMGVKQRITNVTFPNTWWEQGLDPEAAVGVMSQTTPKKIGMVGLGNMSAALHEGIRTRMPNVELVNASNLVEEMRMVKSEAELKLMRQAAYMHEKGYEFGLNAIQPGKTVGDVILEMRREQLSVGSEEQQIAINFGPLGGRRFGGMSWGNITTRRPFKRGDIIHMFLIENSNAGGYWYDLRRMGSLGPVPKEMQEAYDIVKEARQIMADNIKVGQKFGPALAASDNFLKSKGLPPEDRMGGHSQGLDLAERPVIHHDEPAVAQENMIIIPHPAAITKRVTGLIGDNMLITKNGTVPFYKSLFDDDEIHVIG